MKIFTLRLHKDAGRAKHTINGAVFGKINQSSLDFCKQSLGSNDHDFSLAKTPKTSFLTGFFATISHLNIVKALVLVLVALASILTLFFIYGSFFNISRADTLTYPHSPVEESIISLTQPDDVSIDITPTPNGDNIGVSPNSTLVSTNNVTGYNLYLSTESDTNNSLSHLSIDGFSISALANPSSNLINSSWGFTTVNPTNPSTSNFDAVPTSQSPVLINATTEAAEDDETTIYYGAKVAFNLDVAGTYNNTVVYTAMTSLVDAPTITNITPNTGQTSGGETITITGLNYDGIINITIGGNDCTDISITSATTATCNTPAGTAGTQDVIVTNQGGSATLTNGFSYILPSPIVTSICRFGEVCDEVTNSSTGHFYGGETFTITGANFTGATAVNFGGSACRNFTVDSDTQITCLSTGYNLNNTASQNVSVNVTTANGTNTTNTLFTYRYPTTSFVSGQTYTHILGTDIEFGSKVSVGGVECTDLTITSDITLVCNSPVSTLGAKALSITPAPVATANMQNFSEVCNVGNIGTIRILVDTRDGQKYRVRCMEDTKWWMLDDLKLGGTGSAITLTPANSNVSSNFTIPANAITTTANRVTNGVCASGSASGTAGNMTCDGTTTQSDANNAFIAYADPSSIDNPYNDSCQPGAPGLSSDSLSGCGFLYNWYTATAGTGTASMTTGDATSSICPVGWHLPSAGTGTATTANEFAVLNGAMNGNSSPEITNNASTRFNWRDNGAFSGSYAGYWAPSFYTQGSYGYYWSSSADSATYARSLSFYYNSVSPGNITRTKYYGSSVRCVL